MDIGDELRAPRQAGIRSMASADTLWAPPGSSDHELLSMSSTAVLRPKQPAGPDSIHNFVPDPIDTSPPSTSKGLKFWLVFSSMAVAAFLAALDTSIISTSLPTISADLGSGEAYIWIINAYLLTSTASIPIFAQAADIWGRRSLTIASVIIFALGSGLSGGANDMVMLIAGRAVQGIGGGGISTMSEIVVCDLVSIRERGLYAGIIGGVYGIASLVAPIMGGALSEHVSWRWIFYINLPLSALVLVFLVLFLKMRRPPAGSLSDQLTRIDWMGGFLMIGSVAAMVLALSWAGAIYSWTDWRIILPLALGFVGLIAFVGWQACPWVKHPMLPLRLFANRTANSIFVISFIHSLIMFWVCYFLPVYFQAVLGAGPTRSAVMLFPIVATTCPGGIFAGAMMTKTGKYRFWHFFGLGLMTLGCGLFILLDENSSTGMWAGFQLLFGFGLGFVFTTCLPVVLASLPDDDVAAATGAWTVIRNFGMIWGTAIPAAIFNTRANELAAGISDASVRALLLNGGAYEHAAGGFIAQFASRPALQDSIVHLYVESLRLVWQASIAFVGIAFLFAFLVESIPLREDLVTDFGLEESKASHNLHEEQRGDNNSTRLRPLTADLQYDTDSMTKY